MADSPSDATQECISKASTKAADSIDKACATAGANPSCYMGTFTTGAGWVNAVEAVVDGQLPDTFCDSPSGAFLD